MTEFSEHLWTVLLGRRMSPVPRFAVRFAILLGAYYALAMSTFLEERVYPIYLKANAFATGAILKLLSWDVVVAGTQIGTADFAVKVQRGCDALEASAILAIAIVSAPGSLARKAVGVFLGVAFLSAVNIVRIASLFAIGSTAPNLFNVMHADVWQTLFVMLAVVFWVFWAIGVRRSSGETRSAG